MDTLLGITVVGVWIAISVVALKRAYSSRGPSAREPREGARGCARQCGARVTISLRNVV
jgi:hypothetical protein